MSSLTVMSRITSDVQVGVKERISVLAVKLARWEVSWNCGFGLVNIVKRINNLISLHILPVVELTKKRWRLVPDWSRTGPGLVPAWLG